MSITGDLCRTKCSNAKLKELVVEGSTHVQELEMTGFARADARALYRHDWVALEGHDTRRIMERTASPEEFRRGVQTPSVRKADGAMGRTRLRGVVTIGCTTINMLRRE